MFDAFRSFRVFQSVTNNLHVYLYSGANSLSFNNDHNNNNNLNTLICNQRRLSYIKTHFEMWQIHTNSKFALNVCGFVFVFWTHYTKKIAIAHIRAIVFLFFCSFSQSFVPFEFCTSNRNLLKSRQLNLKSSTTVRLSSIMQIPITSAQCHHLCILYKHY